MKTMSSGAGAMFMKKRALEPKLYHFYDGSAALRLEADMGRFQHKCNRLRLLATCSITITNKQNHYVIDYDYIESNHDYNRDYICLETSSERKQTPFAWFDVSIFSNNIRY